MKKSIIISFFAILVIAAFFISSYFYSSTSKNSIVTLLPDSSEIKKKPKDPGGIVIPNSDSLVYERLKGGNYMEKGINFLPDPEEPIEVVKKHAIKTKFLDSIDEILDNIGYYEDKYISINTNDAENLDYVLPNVLLPKQDEPDEQENDDGIHVPGTSLNIIKAIGKERKIANQHVINNEQRGYKIQLSSAYSQQEAKEKWQSIYHKNKKILGDANLIIRKIEGKNERLFFLVMAGSYPSLSHAKLLCKRLSQRSQNCIITK